MTVVVDLAPVLPAFAQIEPVGRCNLACRMCPVHERGDEAAMLPFERFRQLLDEMPGLRHLHLQGLGEPMLHPRFFDMVSLAAGRGIEVGCNTNLTLLTPARAQACVDSGLSSVSLSIDGASAGVYESIRRGASFAKVLRNLDRLVAARDAAGGRPALRGVMVLMRANAHELADLVSLLHAHGVRELLVQRLANDWRDTALPARYVPVRQYVEAAELRPPDEPAVGHWFGQARGRAESLGFTLHLPRGPAPGAAAEPLPASAPRCGWPWQQVYITAAGQMLPCCMVGTADRASFGPAFGDGASVQRAWHGPAAQAFRGALAGASPPAVCRSCALYHGRF